MIKFDYYEFVGFIIPGAIALFGLSLLYPEIKAFCVSQNYSIGDLGIFAILSYAVGHLIQGVGNLVEKLWWWPWDGMPTNWIPTNKGNLLASLQIKALEEQLPSKLKLNHSFSFKGLNIKDWFDITQQVYACVASQGKAFKIDALNGNYAINRGIASSIIILLIFSILTGNYSWKVALLYLAGISIALYRMNHFGKQYARKLFVEFLQLKET
jgi:hypothetical protein